MVARWQSLTPELLVVVVAPLSNDQSPVKLEYGRDSCCAPKRSLRFLKVGKPPRKSPRAQSAYTAKPFANGICPLLHKWAGLAAIPR